MNIYKFNLLLLLLTSYTYASETFSHRNVSRTYSHSNISNNTFEIERSDDAQIEDPFDGLFGIESASHNRSSEQSAVITYRGLNYELKKDDSHRAIEVNVLNPNLQGVLQSHAEYMKKHVPKQKKNSISHPYTVSLPTTSGNNNASPYRKRKKPCMKDIKNKLKKYNNAKSKTKVLNRPLRLQGRDISLSNSNSYRYTDQASSKRIQCTKCLATFSRKHSYKHHFDCIHLKITRYQCPYCDYRAYDRWGIQSHVKSEKHLAEKPYQCNLCRKCFSRKHYWK